MRSIRNHPSRAGASRGRCCGRHSIYVQRREWSVLRDRGGQARSRMSESQANRQPAAGAPQVRDFCKAGQACPQIRRASGVALVEPIAATARRAGSRTRREMRALARVGNQTIHSLRARGGAGRSATSWRAHRNASDNLRWSVAHGRRAIVAQADIIHPRD